LREMPKIDAPPGFEADLMRRINSEKYAEAKPGLWERFFKGFFRPIPSAIAVGAVAIVAFVLLVNSPGDEGGKVKDNSVVTDLGKVQAAESEKNNTALTEKHENDRPSDFNSKEQDYTARSEPPGTQQAPKPQFDRDSKAASGITVGKQAESLNKPAAAIVSAPEIQRDAQPDAVVESTETSSKPVVKGKKYGVPASVINTITSFQKKTDSLKVAPKDTTLKK